MRKETTAFQHSTHDHVQKQRKTHDCTHDVIHVVVYFQHVHEKHSEFQNDDENDGRQHKPFHKRRRRFHREMTMLLQLIYYINIIFLLYLCIQHQSHDTVIGEVRIVLIWHVIRVNFMT
jgi:uncharacterized membrane protein (DUF485 family)